MKELSGVWVCKDVTYRVHIKLTVVCLKIHYCLLDAVLVSFLAAVTQCLANAI